MCSTPHPGPGLPLETVRMAMPATLPGSTGYFLRLKVEQHSVAVARQFSSHCCTATRSTAHHTLCTAGRRPPGSTSAANCPGCESTPDPARSEANAAGGPARVVVLLDILPALEDRASNRSPGGSMLRFALHRQGQNSQVSRRCHGMSCRGLTLVLPSSVGLGYRPTGLNVTPSTDRRKGFLPAQNGRVSTQGVR